MSFLSLAQATALLGAWLMYPAQVPVSPRKEATKAMLSLVETDNGRTVDIRRGETVRDAIVTPRSRVAVT